MRRNHRNPKPPKRTAPGAQDAQKADQSKHHHSAPSRTSLPEAVLNAIDDAQQAGKWAIRALQCGNVTASMTALDQAMRAMSTAAITAQGLAR